MSLAPCRLVAFLSIQQLVELCCSASYLDRLEKMVRSASATTHDVRLSSLTGRQLASTWQLAAAPAGLPKGLPSRHLRLFLNCVSIFAFLILHHIVLFSLSLSQLITAGFFLPFP